MKVIRIAVLSLSLTAFTLQGVENESVNSEAVLQVDAESLAGVENQIYRLYDGIMVYVHNNDGKDFTVTLDLRDLNIFANGPREVLFKVYDPDGIPVVREVFPDDGVASRSYLPRIGGWDHELDYYIWCYSRGSQPMLRWSAWSDMKRLATVPYRRYVRNIKAGKKGIYRIQALGDRDHYATVKTDPDLPSAVCGHHTWLVGRGSQWKQTFIYVPKGTAGIHLGFAEPDEPRTRHFTLLAPDGKKLFDGTAAGMLTVTNLNFEKPGQYDGQLLRLAVSDGPNDYMVHLSLKQLAEGIFKEYVGFGSLALFARDRDTANAVMGGTFVEDGLVFWHKFQVRAHRWLKANPNAPEDIRDLFEMMRLIGPGDGRGSPTWTNLAYDFGYYGCKIWRPGWQLMARGDTPKEVKDIIREAFILGGDRLSFSVNIEKCNGNAFSQINVALWYCSQATGDALQKERFETFFERWRSEGWGEGSGLSKSGDSQEHFAHDCNYGWYLMENWAGGNWVPNGILADTTDQRFSDVFNRYRNLYSYLACKDAAANTWSSRTAQSVSDRWAGDKDVPWKGEPGPDFTVSVNDGNEWFAARRKNYYFLSFHGRLPPAWLCNTFPGPIGFGAGAICQLTVPGKGTVLASTQNNSYGQGMQLHKWRNYHLHSVVGELADGRPLVTAHGEHPNAKLVGNTVSSDGEVQDRPVHCARKYTFRDDAIDCEMQLSLTEYNTILQLWMENPDLGKVSEAYEMIPFLKARVSTIAADGNDAGELKEAAVTAKTVVIDRGGFGVRIDLEKPAPVRLSADAQSVLIQLASKDTPPVDVQTIGLKYRLMPFQ